MFALSPLAGARGTAGALACVAAFLFCANAHAADAPYRFFVAPTGNDAWSGTLPEADAAATDGPFATFERARDAVRALKQEHGLPAGGLAVGVRGGVYQRDATFELTAEDSGADGAPVVYRAYGDEAVHIIGGRRIEGFGPVTDAAVMERLDPAVRDRVLCVDLGAQGITDYGALTRRGFSLPNHPSPLELFFNGEPMTLARWPNDDWAVIAEVPDGPDAGYFVYEGDRPARWAGLDDVWVYGYWTHDWADSFERVQAVDPEKRAIHTVAPHGVYGYKKGSRFFALNVLEELDSPGEYYIDRAPGVLYFLPPGPIDGADVFVSLLSTPMAQLTDASHIVLRGFTFEFSRGRGVGVKDGADCLVAGCVFRNLGINAVTVGGGERHGVVGCDIHNMAAGGISLSGGDRATLTPAGHYAVNNHIHRYSLVARTYRPAVGVSGVGHRVAHNLIHDGTHNGIQLGGNNHLVEFNELHHVCQDTGDVGAFYTGRDWTIRGTVIRYNHFHHITGPGRGGAMAVYLDDAASGFTIFGNVFYRAARAAFIGGGRDNIVENNIFVECEPSVHVDERGLGWAAKYITPDGGWDMYKKLEAVRHDQPPYSLWYPRLKNILDDDPPVPKGNMVLRNISVGGRWADLPKTSRDEVLMRYNLTEGDPGFVDAEALNFQLREDSPAYALGFQRIPMERIGLYLDEYRRERPE